MCCKYYILLMTPDDLKGRFADLQRQLQQIGIPIPGTIHGLYARCGSPTCPCATDDQKRHGPYYRWHYRLKGKYVAQGINPEDLSLFKEWIGNREEINRILEDMLSVGAQLAASRSRQLTQMEKERNPKKGSTRKRGK